jgi:hypothetical protein
MPVQIFYLGFLMLILLLVGMEALGILSLVAWCVAELLRLYRQTESLSAPKLAMERFLERTVRIIWHKVMGYWTWAGSITLGYMGLTMLIHTLLCLR